MKEMSISMQRARDLVTAYDHSLEQQIVGRGSNLVCRDEELLKEVEGLLRDGDAQETHCLGLDPLRLMEESLKAAAAAAAAATTTAAATAASAERATGGLQGLAKAFEVLEQASLNLYLSPWREEYKTVKMYSGMFTHYIKPVLSMSQIEKLFGLLGYEPGSSGHEQLRLQSPRVGASSLDNLRLSCAFFLARCECRLLLVALGKHVGKIQWELSVVRERQRGNNLQVSLDNTRKTLEVNKPSMEPLEVEVDLYTDEQVNGGQRGLVVSDDESPHSLTSAAVKAHSNGMTSLSSSFTALSTREQTSKFNCQPSMTSLLDSDSRRQGRRPCEELMKADSQSHSLQTEAARICLNAGDCSCLQSPHLRIELCVDCNTLHNITCALHKHCCTESHRVVFPDNPREEANDSRAVSSQGGSLRVSGMSALPTLTSSSSTMSSSALLDGDPKSIIPSLHPITYHDCCDLTQLDPQVVCFSCGVFHSGSCRGIHFCQRHHQIKGLGVCSCGRACSRNPIVLCRYCGNEYCTECWYRNPLECTCGQTFDLSSSV